MSLAKMALVVPVALTLSLGLTGCGSDSKDSSGAKGSEQTAGATATSIDEALAQAQAGKAGSLKGDDTPLTPEQLQVAGKFVECMRGLGYDMPEATDPGFNFAPRNSQAMGGDKLKQVGQDATKCSNKVGGSAITGG